jgi:hypothetical protein
MQVHYAHTDLPTVSRIVSEQKGSWRWQDAYRKATYAPHLTCDGRWVWKSYCRTRKFAATRATADLFRAYCRGSLHHKPVESVGVDDFGNQFFATH